MIMVFLKNISTKAKNHSAKRKGNHIPTIPLLNATVIPIESAATP
jgi:hypothetical protein